MENFCCYCGFMGHNVGECMRRGTSQAQENTGDIKELRNELSSIEKSLANVEDLKSIVDSLDSKMTDLIKWQMEVVDPALAGLHKTEEGLANLQRTVDDKLQNVVQVSAFNMWLKTDFQTVKDLASAALPRSEFDKYVADME